MCGLVINASWFFLCRLLGDIPALVAKENFVITLVTFESISTSYANVSLDCGFVIG